MPQEKPTVFVGSSSEGLKIAQAIQVALDHDCDVEIWSQGTFGLMSGTLEALVAAAERFDFAVFVVTPNDMTLSRGKSLSVARDNVLFELGLFIGALGRERTFMVFDRKNRPDLPSDLAGVTPATYEVQKSGNLTASLGSPCTQILRAIEQLRTRAQKPAGIEAYVSRPKTPLETELFAVKKVWFAWHAGSVKLAQGDLLNSSRKIRAILTKPGSRALAELGKVANLTGAEMSKDIRSLTRLLQDGRHEVKWIDGFIGSSLIIADPESETAWARVEALVPFAAPASRPSVVIRKTGHPAEFAVMLQTYKRLWKIATLPE